MLIRFEANARRELDKLFARNYMVFVEYEVGRMGIGGEWKLSPDRSGIVVPDIPAAAPKDAPAATAPGPKPAAG